MVISVRCMDTFAPQDTAIHTLSSTGDISYTGRNTMADTAVDGQRKGKKKKGAALVVVLSATFVLAASGVLSFPAITVGWPNAYHDDS